LCSRRLRGGPSGLITGPSSRVYRPLCRIICHDSSALCPVRRPCQPVGAAATLVTAGCNQIHHSAFTVTPAALSPSISVFKLAVETTEPAFTLQATRRTCRIRVDTCFHEYSCAADSVMVPRRTISPRGILEAQFSLPWRRCERRSNDLYVQFINNKINYKKSYLDYTKIILTLLRLPVSISALQLN